MKVNCYAFIIKTDRGMIMKSQSMIRNSYYGASNTSNKISAGMIDINITQSITIALNLSDFREISRYVSGLSIIDFDEWTNLIIDYNMTMINQKKANARQYTFYFKNNENFDFSTDPFNGEKEIFFSEDRKDPDFFSKLKESIYDTYMSNYLGLKEEQENIEKTVGLQSSISYIDDDSIVMDNDGVVLKFSGKKADEFFHAIEDYFATYYENSIQYMKKYIKTHRALENIENAKVFDDNKVAIESFKNKDVVNKNDVLNLLRVFFPEYDMIEYPEKH
jgi:hypothetical protein